MYILFYRYGSICEPDVISGFQELGCKIHELTVETTHKTLSAATRVQLLCAELLADSYDCIFSINYFPFISEVANIFKIRYICWTVDSPVMDLFADSVKHPWNRIFCFDSAQYNDIVARNPSCIFHLPLATNPARWNRIISNATPKQITTFRGDISFVGSLYSEKCPFNRLTDAPDYLQGYLNAIMDAQQQVFGYYFLEDVLPEEIVLEFKNHLPGFYTPPENHIHNDCISMARLYLCPQITVNERTHIMHLLGSHFSVNLYTGSNTTDLPVNNCGLAKTLTEMPLIFHHSKINLNLTTKSIRSGLPLRIFDILGCGGFLLTNYQQELFSYFKPGEDLVYYTNDDDLLQKTEFYLTHEKERKEIALNGFETVKKHHNYPERLAKMLVLAFGNS